MAKGLSIILGLGKPKGTPKDDSSSEGAPSSASMPAADDFYSLAFDALKDDDKEAFKEALKGAVEDCMGEKMSEDEK